MATYTYDELENIIDEHIKNMGDEERYLRLKYADPTFEEFVFSYMKKGDVVDVNYEELTFEIL